jgi:phytoene dehydrogenase-like protein
MITRPGDQPAAATVGGMARVAVVGAGLGGLSAAARLAALGHTVTVLEQAPEVGGKLGWFARDGHGFDTGPSLLTLPDVQRDLFAATGAPLRDEVELLRVEPVTRYSFADGTGFELSADLPRALEALEAWSPGAGADWVRFLGTCAGMWRASVPFLTGPPPWPPRRDSPPAAADLLRVKPWWTLRRLARAHARDARLRMIIERFASYAGGDPRRMQHGARQRVARLVERTEAEHVGAGDRLGGHRQHVANDPSHAGVCAAVRLQR